MSLIKLPYLGSNAYGTINKSPYGYNEVDGADQYIGANTRNVYIVRVDLLSYLSEHFSDTTVQHHRSVLYYILAGYGKDDQKKLILEGLSELYKQDSIFRIKLGKIVYFRDSEMEMLSVYDALLEDARKSLAEVWNIVYSSVPCVKFLFDSKLYLYFSVSNSIPITTVQNIKGLEVISRC